MPLNKNEKAKKHCDRFEPQAWRKILCKNCFKTLDEHSADYTPPRGQPPPSLDSTNYSSENDSKLLSDDASSKSFSAKQHEAKMNESSGNTQRASGVYANSTPSVHSASNSKSTSDDYVTTTNRQSNSRETFENKHNIGQGRDNDTSSSNKAAPESSRLKGNDYQRVNNSEDYSNYTSIRSPTSDSGFYQAPRDGDISFTRDEYLNYRDADTAGGEHVYSTLPRAKPSPWNSRTLDDSTMSSYEYLRGGETDVKRLLVESLREKVATLEDQCRRQERENKAVSELLSSKKMDYERMRDHYSELMWDLENQVQRLVSEKARLVDKLQLPESERSSLAAEENEIAELRKKLDEQENRVFDLAHENENLREEVRDLQLEMAELHDQFREEETIEFRELQKELENAAKTCRLLQFKLRKTERRNEQLENDRTLCDEKIRHLENCIQSSDDKRKLRMQEEEVRLAKESVQRIHEQMEKSEDRRRRTQEELDKTKNSLNEADNKRLFLQNQLDSLKHEVMVLKGQKIYETKQEAIIPPKPSKDAEERLIILNQLTKDLKDSLEREHDLKEQLNFVEKECSTMRKKMMELENENEVISTQLKKLASKKSSKFSSTADEASMEEQDAAMLGEQLSYADKEIRALKKEVEEMKTDNTNLLCAIKFLKGKIEQKDSGRCSTPLPPDDEPAKEFLQKLGLETFKVVEADFKKKLQLAHDDILSLNKDLKRLKEKNNGNSVKESLEKEIANLTSKLKDGEEKIKLLQKELESSKKEKSTLEDLKPTNESLKRKIKELEELMENREKMYKERERKREASIMRENEEDKQAKEKRRDSSKSRSNGQVENDSATEKDNSTESNEDSAATIKDLEKKIESLEKKRKKDATKREKDDAEKQALQEEVDKLNEKIDSYKAKLKKEKEKNASSENKKNPEPISPDIPATDSIPKLNNGKSAEKNSSDSHVDPNVLEVTKNQLSKLQAENELLAKHSKETLLEIKKQFLSEFTLWEKEREDFKKNKKMFEETKKNFSNAEKEIEKLKIKLKGEESRKKDLENKLRVAENSFVDSDKSDAKKPEEKKVAEFRSKFEKFGGTTPRPVRRPSIEGQSQGQGQGDLLKELQKQISESEEGRTKEREEMAAKMENAKKEMQTQLEDAHNKYDQLRSRLDEIVKSQMDLLNLQKEEEDQKMAWMSERKHLLTKLGISEQDFVKELQQYENGNGSKLTTKTASRNKEDSKKENDNTKKETKIEGNGKTENLFGVSPLKQSSPSSLTTNRFTKARS